MCRASRGGGGGRGRLWLESDAETEEVALSRANQGVCGSSSTCFLGFPTLAAIAERRWRDVEQRIGPEGPIPMLSKNVDSGSQTTLNW